MGYTLYGFIAKRGTFEPYKQLDNRISVAELEQGFDLLLNDAYLDEALNLGASEDPESFKDWLLSHKLIDHFSELSKKTPIAYILVEYAGGAGQQQAVVWKDRQIVLKQETAIARAPESYGPVNKALLEIGVIAQSDKDEFQSIGLYRNRNMADWFEECTGISFKEHYQDL